MYERVKEVLPRIYAPAAMPSVALAIGGQQPRMVASEPMIEMDPVQHPDDADRTDQLARWASDRAKKFLAAEIVVGTLDQALLAGLAVRHAHLRLAALSRHLLVVDELHSYDRYMAVALANLLDLFTRADGIALFMSATLSDAERRRFGSPNAEVPACQTTADRPYPVLSIREPGAAEWREEPLDSGYGGRSKRIAWCTLSQAGWMNEAIRAAEAGIGC